LVGRDVLDETGHKIGEVDDLDVDFDSMKIDSIILHEGGHIIGGKERVIPFNMVETVGERVILKKETGSRMGGREEGMRDEPMERRERY
ncbi:MAG: PRC-barrel domain-containing protein, partial [Methanobacterium sp.]